MNHKLGMATGFGQSRQPAQDIDICRYNIYPYDCAGGCGQLHLCRLFVANMCPYDETCKTGHTLLDSSHNVSILRDHGVWHWQYLSEDELLDDIEAGYLARNPITDLERSFALQICRAYLYHENGCEDEECWRLHVCDDYIAGTCANGKGCEFSHQIYTSANAANTRRVGLNGMQHSEILEVLRDPPTAREVWQDRLAQDVNLCQHNIFPSRCAGDCGELHLCRLFVADMCPYEETCRSGHNLHSFHNEGVLEQIGMDNLSDEDLLDAIEAGYLDLNPITDLERRSALQMCRAYLYDEDGCDEEDCWRLHLCDDYVAGTCGNGSGCEFSHQIYTSANIANIKRVGLNGLRHSEILEVLRNRPTAKTVWKSITSQ